MTYTLQSFTSLIVVSWVVIYLSVQLVGNVIGIITQGVAHEHDLKVKIRRGESDAVL
jgi:hypothetical protein